MFSISSFFTLSKTARRFGWLLAGGNGAVLLVNLFVGALLHGNPFLPLADGENLLAIVFTGTLLGTGVFLADRLLWLIESRQQKPAWKQGATLLVFHAVFLLLLSSCELETSSRVQVKSQVQGSVSNAATGLKAVYRNMEAEKIKLVMNDAVLGHADIPLGEKFYIVNDGIKGLVAKDGMVSIGCSLQITDEQGNVILDEPDLFSGNDLFKKEAATYLQCAVSTGRPMETEYYYTVRAKFWDKYGDGFIDNTVRIRAIDLP